MTRKDFELIARTLRETRPDFAGQLPEGRAFRTHQWGKDVKAFAKMCAAQNVRFREDIFFAACGLTSEDI